MEIKRYKEKVLSGEIITKQEALHLLEAPIEELCSAADELRKRFCGDYFDMCTIVNGKSGRCSEDCKYCAQSAYYQTCIDSYGLMDTERLLEQAKYNEERGIQRYSIVTSGKKLNEEEVNQVCASIRTIKQECDLKVCVSFGLLDEAQFNKLAQAGAERVHNNLESSEEYFKNICTTHTYQEKVDAIQAAQRAGLSICSGGIIGLGESMEDRITMACKLRELGVDSVPINFLNPIQGTPYAANPVITNDEACRIVAIFRFLLPQAFIRLAGGRGLLPDKGKRCFCSGANAAITGDLLTTTGTTIESDAKMVKELGFFIRF